jgi:anaerobic selenocysteine-containing dehydrogenase
VLFGLGHQKPHHDLEMARAAPLYRGIEKLERKGDQVQWGGRTLYSDGRFATSDGKARFSPVSTDRIVRAAAALGRSGSDGGRRFVVSTRRGKQFNSMVQREVDPLTGARRDAVFMSDADAQRLGIGDGAPVRLCSGAGVFEGHVQIANIKPGNLEVQWPEGNVLLLGAAIDPDSMEPDYNAVVTLEAQRD